jgi:hypothetical protein
VLDWTLTRAADPSHANFAARWLPWVVRAVRIAPFRGRLVRDLSEDRRWPARYAAGRVLGSLVPRHMPAEEAWERLVRLAADPAPFVPEAVPHGIADVVTRMPRMAGGLEDLIADGDAPLAVRRCAVRSLAVLATQPATAELGMRLLSVAAVAPGRASHGIGAAIVGRAIAARDSARAEAIARAWSESDAPRLRDQGRRALRALGL